MKWRVYNRHPDGLTHREKFRDESIEIKAGEYILMDYEDAVRFRGAYFPMIKNAQGALDPKGYKVIHIEPDNIAATAAPTIMAKEFICHLDGAKFPTQAMLDKYLKDNYAEATFKDEALDKEIEQEIEVKRKGRPAAAKEKHA